MVFVFQSLCCSCQQCHRLRPGQLLWYSIWAHRIKTTLRGLKQVRTPELEQVQREAPAKANWSQLWLDQLIRWIKWNSLSGNSSAGCCVNTPLAQNTACKHGHGVRLTPRYTPWGSAVQCLNTLAVHWTAQMHTTTPRAGLVCTSQAPWTGSDKE